MLRFVSRYPDTAQAHTSLTLTLNQELQQRVAAAQSNTTTTTHGAPTVRVASVNPGAVNSDIWRHLPLWLQPVTDCLFRLLFLTPTQGAATALHAACDATLLSPATSPTPAPYLVPYWIPWNLVYPFEFLVSPVWRTNLRPHFINPAPRPSPRVLSTAQQRRPRIGLCATGMPPVDCMIGAWLSGQTRFLRRRANSSKLAIALALVS